MIYILGFVFVSLLTFFCLVVLNFIYTLNRENEYQKKYDPYRSDPPEEDTNLPIKKPVAKQKDEEYFQRRTNE